MTAEERRRLLAKEFEEDDKDKKPSKKSSSKENDNEGKKGSAAKKVAGVAIGLGAAALAVGGVKSYVDSHTSETGDKNAIVYDTDDAEEKTGLDKEIADEAARISEVQDKLTKASEVLAGIDNKVLATDERAGKFQDMIFDLDGDGREEDFADQFNEKLTSYQARLTKISAIEDETEKAVQFALLKEEMKDIKMILDTNDDEKVYENKIKVIQDGYNQNENKAAKASYNHIANLYGENPVFTYEGDIQDIERFADAIVNGTDVDIKVTAFETHTRLEDGRFKNDESLLNGQEITLDLVNKREQVKAATKQTPQNNIVYKPVVKQTPTKTPTIPGPGPSTPDVPLPDPVTPPVPTPSVTVETQTVVNPTVPVVQTEDQEEKISETITSETITGVQPQEETQGVTNVPTGPAVYEGHEPTQSYDFDAVVSVYDAYIESACEEYAEASVAAEETQSADNEQQSAPESQAQPEEETVME